jgi:rod shape-determining protein MreD
VTGLLIAVLFIAGLTVQTSVLALSGPGGVHPDFLLLAVIVLALLSDVRRGAFLGCAAGLLQEIVLAAPLGFFTFGKVLAGVLAGLLAREIHKDFLLSPVLIVTALGVFAEAATFMLHYLLFAASPFLFDYLTEVAVPRAVMHALLTAVLYPFFYRLQKRGLLFAEHES